MVYLFDENGTGENRRRGLLKTAVMILKMHNSFISFENWKSYKAERHDRQMWTEKLLLMTEALGWSCIRQPARHYTRKRCYQSDVFIS